MTCIVENQSIIDIAVQEYGTQEATVILIDDNPDLFTNNREFEITNSLPVDTVLNIREEDDVMNKKVLKELDGKVIVSES